MDNKAKRPVIKIVLSDADKAQEKLALWLLIILWVCVIGAYFILPATIPVHFNIKNEPDKWDDRAYIFMMPFIATLLYSLLGFVNKYPQNFNYIKPVTLENAQSQYTMGTRLLRLIKLMLIVGFFIDTANDVIVARNPSFHETLLSMILQWSPVVLIAYALIRHLLSQRKIKA